MSGRRSAAMDAALALIDKGYTILAAAREAGLATSSVQRAMRNRGDAPRPAGRPPKESLMQTYEVRFDDRNRARNVEAVSPDSAALEAAGAKARSARVDALYDAPVGGKFGINKGGYAMVSVLLDDGSRRRAQVSMANPVAATDAE